MFVTSAGNTVQSYVPQSFVALPRHPSLLDHKSLKLPAADQLPLKRQAFAENPLSRREVDVLAWIVRGKSDWQIGEILMISHKTVNYHVERAKRKLRVRTRLQAAFTAVQLGLVVPAAGPVGAVS